MSEEQYFIDDDGFVVDKTDLHILMDNDDCCEELNELVEENKELKENVSELIHEAIVEILDGQRYEGERILNEALRLLE